MPKKKRDMKTKSQTKTTNVTDAKLAVATLALALAAGLAFGFVPMNKKLNRLPAGFSNAPKSGCTASIQTYGEACDDTHWQRAVVKCSDGRQEALRSNECRTQKTWNKEAYKYCDQTCTLEDSSKKVVNKEEKADVKVKANVKTVDLPEGVTQLVSCSDRAIPAGNYQLTEDIVIPAAHDGGNVCLLLGNANTTINCDGHRISGGNDRTVGASLSASNVTLQNCVFDNIHAPIVMNDRSLDAIAVGNTIQGGGSDAAIHVRGAQRAQITDNRINSSEGYGIHLREVSGVNITGNTVSNANSAGIYVDIASNNSIRGNTIEDGQRYGIYILESDSINVTNNTIRRNDLGIAAVTSMRNGIHQNTITENRRDGISIGGEDQRITGNTLSSNGRHGLHISSEGSTVSNNTAERNHDYGISLRGNDNIIEENTISRNELIGLYVFGASRNVLRDNLVTHNAGSGINISDNQNNTGDNIVEFNTLENNSTGLAISRSRDNIVRNNTISNNTKGVGIYRDTLNTQIVNNTISRNSQFGIKLGLGITVAQRELLGDQANGVPPTGTTISSNIICDNPSADLTCEIQMGTNGAGSSIQTVNACEVGEALELDFSPCR